MNYSSRIKKIKTLLQQEELDAILISSVANIIYLSGFSNFSQEEREAYIFITKNAEYIFTDLRYTEAVGKEVSHLKLIEITPSKSYQQVFIDIAKKEKLVHVGIEEDNLTVSEFQQLQKSFRELHPMEISGIRGIKEQNEINFVEKACELGDKTFEYLLTKIKEKITEKELAFELEFFVKKQGGELSFNPIVAFGSHSSVPHHQTNNESRLRNNSIVLLDFGTKINNYCSDMTRSIFFGKANDKFKKMYETVKVAQEKSIELLVNSQSSDVGSPLLVKDIDLSARNHIESQGFPSIPHAVGHGIGLQVHELPYVSPNSHDKLKSGMVFSIEPGIYLPGIGGVRIEDLVAIEKNGVKQLTKSPKQLIEL